MEPVSDDKPKSGGPPAVNGRQGCAGCSAIVAVGMIFFGIAMLVGAIDGSPTQQYSHHEIRQNPSFFLDRGTPEFHPSNPNLVREKRTPLFERKAVHNTIYHTNGERLVAAILGIGLAFTGFWICSWAKRILSPSLAIEEMPKSSSKDHKVSSILSTMAVLVVACGGTFFIWNNSDNRDSTPQRDISSVPDTFTTSTLNGSIENTSHSAIADTKQDIMVLPIKGDFQTGRMAEPSADSDKNNLRQAAPENTKFDQIQLVSTDGRMIQAKILALSKTTVIVKRDDGQEFEIPLDRIAAESKALIEAYRESKRKNNEH